MPKAIRIHRHGGPEEMVFEPISLGDPGPGEVKLKQTAIGLNYIDVYHRTGLYPVPSLPAVLGMEGAGQVVALGQGVETLSVGDRVAYASAPIGSYAEERLMPAARLVKLPDHIEDSQAAALMLQGMTVHYLLRRTYRINRGDTILLHAAAGGIGLIACQWARALGATVIGTVGSEAKAELAKAHGCTHTILYNQENIAERVRELTNGEGVAVVYDSVGKDTLTASLDSLRPLGMLVSFGNASGPTGPIDPLQLAQRGSLFFTRPSLIHYTAQREDLENAANDVFQMVASGQVKIAVNQHYALADAAQAHRDLEARKTTGSTILLP